MKFLKKWSYLIILLLCGVAVMGVSDSWKLIPDPAAPGDRTEASGPEHTEGSSQEANLQESMPQNPDMQDPELQDPGTQGSDIQEPEIQNTGAPEQEVTWRDPSEVVYAAAEDDYFSDAVFIGDSRTVGMYEYGGLENISTFYASTGLTVYSLFDSAIVEVPGQKDRITVEQALSEKQFAKIYLMVGINEMGRGDLEGFLAEYAAAVERLKELQPDAIIYLQGILKVSAIRNSKGDHIHNAGIEERNVGIASLADNVRVYYLDANPVLCDENGCLESSYTSDGVHLKAKYIPLWKDFLKQHTVVLD